MQNLLVENRTESDAICNLTNKIRALGPQIPTPTPYSAVSATCDLEL
jgi:hypothetical protein